MAYIGNTPADKFLTLTKQNFSTSATTSYTLDNSVSSTQDIALFINNVRQSPVDAYSVSGTALTLTSATAGTDEMYCVYLGKTVGTVSPASDSVTTAMIQANAVNNAKMSDDAIGLAELSATGTPSSSNFLRGDNAWATAGGDNTPSFCAYLSADQSVSASTDVKIQFNTEVFDTDSAYDNSSNYRFTVPSGEAGKYVIMMDVHGANSDTGATSMNGYIYKNGSLFRQVNNHLTANSILRMHLPLNFIDDASVSDYYECYVNLSGSSTKVEGGTGTFGSTFMMYKLII